MEKLKAWFKEQEELEDCELARVIWQIKWEKDWGKTLIEKGKIKSLQKLLDKFYNAQGARNEKLRTLFPEYFEEQTLSNPLGIKTIYPNPYNKNYRKKITFSFKKSLENLQKKLWEEQTIKDMEDKFNKRVKLINDNKETTEQMRQEKIKEEDELISNNVFEEDKDSKKIKITFSIGNPQYEHKWQAESFISLSGRMRVADQVSPISQFMWNMFREGPEKNISYDKYMMMNPDKVTDEGTYFEDYSFPNAFAQFPVGHTFYNNLSLHYDNDEEIKPSKFFVNKKFVPNIERFIDNFERGSNEINGKKYKFEYEDEQTKQFIKGNKGNAKKIITNNSWDKVPENFRNTFIKIEPNEETYELKINLIPIEE